MARFLFVDFPLGNPLGKPNDVAMQRSLASLALDVLERAFVPRTTVQAPVVWDEADDGWRERFMHVGDDNRADLAAAGAERRRLQDEMRDVRRASRRGDGGAGADDDAQRAG